MEGLVVNLDAITRREVRQWREGRRQVIADGGDFDKHDWDNFYSKILVEWPFEGEISFENYLDLTLQQTLLLQEAVMTASNSAQKK